MDLLAIFKTDCACRGVRASSLATYEGYVRPFLEHSPQIDTQRALLTYIETRYRGYTRRKAWEHLRIFLNWGHAQGLWPEWYKGFRVLIPRPEPPPTMTADECARLIAAIPNTLAGTRNRCVITLLMTTGARRSSILSARIEDLDIPSRWIRLRVMKGGKVSSKSIPPAAIPALTDWLAVRPESRWLFPSQTNPDRPVRHEVITHAVPKYARKAGITKRCWCHGLRHGFATQLAQEGTPAEVIMQALDHADITMSLAYIRRSRDAVRQATDRLFSASSCITCNPPYSSQADSAIAAVRQRVAQAG